MDQKGAELIIATLNDYSIAAEDALFYLQKYDYRDEATRWDEDDQPTIMEAEHPTLHDLNWRLSHFMVPITHLSNNLEQQEFLNRENLDGLINYLQASQDRCLAAKLNRVSIEPMLSVSNEFKNVGRLKEARRLRMVYDYAYSIRQWYKKTKYNPGTPIQLNIEINYDEVTPEEFATDEGYRIFEKLFLPSCNYSTKQKRTLYNMLKALYTDIDPKDADRTVMAVILIFRKPRTIYGRPWNKESITTCKNKAMAAFGRDTKVIASYSENSLDGQPKLGQDHVKRAESIIAKSLESFK